MEEIWVCEHTWWNIGGSYEPSAYNQLDESFYNYSTDDPYIYRAPKPLPFTSYSTNLESNVTHLPSPSVPQTQSQNNSAGEQTGDLISDRSHHDISESYSEVKNVAAAAVNQIVRWVSSCSKFPQVWSMSLKISIDHQVTPQQTWFLYFLHF